MRMKRTACAASGLYTENGRAYRLQESGDRSQTISQRRCNEPLRRY